MKNMIKRIIVFLSAVLLVLPFTVVSSFVDQEEKEVCSTEKNLAEHFEIQESNNHTACEIMEDTETQIAIAQNTENECVLSEKTAGTSATMEAETMDNFCAYFETADNITQNPEDDYSQCLENLEKAKAEVEEADEKASAAIDELSDAITPLEEILIENVQSLTKKIVLATALSAALNLSHLAVKIAQSVVETDTAELNRLNEQKANLNNKIAETQTAIAEAENQLAALDKEDADFSVAKNALDAAKNALNAAQLVYNDSEAIIEGRSAAYGEGGFAEEMEELQEKVRVGVATVEDTQKLTEIVLNNLGWYDSAAIFGTIRWEDNDVFCIEDGDENQTFYLVKTAGTDNAYYLQYYPAIIKTEKAIVTLPEAKDVYTEEGTTVYHAYDTEGNTYAVTTLKTTVFGIDLFGYSAGGNAMSYSKKNQCYTIKINRQTVNLSIYETTDPYFEVNGEALKYTSNSISQMWEQVDNSYEVLQKAEENLAYAEADYVLAEENYLAQKDVLDDIIAENQVNMDALQAQMVILNQAINGLEKQLNSSPESGLLSALMSLYSGIQDGIDEEDISNVVSLCKDTFSAGFILNIFQKIEEVLETSYEKAKTDLDESASDAQSKLVSPVSETMSAAYNVYKSSVEALETTMKYYLAKANLAEAEGFKTLADISEEIAQNVSNFVSAKSEE